MHLKETKMTDQQNSRITTFHKMITHINKYYCDKLVTLYQTFYTLQKIKENMVVNETKIDLVELKKLYDSLTKQDDLGIPDYAVFHRTFRELNPQVKVPDYTYIGGNIPENHEKIRWHSGKADGEYLGRFDIIELYADSYNKVSALTAIHEYIHYRCKHKEIEMTEEQVHKEAEKIYKKLGY